MIFLLKCYIITLFENEFSPENSKKLARNIQLQAQWQINSSYTDASPSRSVDNLTAQISKIFDNYHQTRALI